MMSMGSMFKRVFGSRRVALPPCRIYTMQMRGLDGIRGTLTRLSPEGDFSQSSIDRHGKKVAFWGTEPNVSGYHLWVADIPSHSCSRLTSRPGLHGHPAWWPDGKSLVCFSTVDVSDSSVWDAANQFNPARPSTSLFRICLETGERTRLTRGNWVDERPTVSPCGREIVFVSNRSGKLNLWLLDIDSSDIRQLTKNSDLDYRPAFSWEGDRLAYFRKSPTGTHQLAIMTWPGNAPIDIDTAGNFVWVHGPFWSGQTNSIFFHALRHRDSRPHLWRLNLDTQKISRLVLPGVKGCSHGAFDQSETTLAFDARERMSARGPAVVATHFAD